MEWIIVGALLYWFFKSGKGSKEQAGERIKRMAVLLFKIGVFAVAMFFLSVIVLALDEVIIGQGETPIFSLILIPVGVVYLYKKLFRKPTAKKHDNVPMLAIEHAAKAFTPEPVAAHEPVSVSVPSPVPEIKISVVYDAPNHYEGLGSSSSKTKTKTVSQWHKKGEVVEVKGYRINGLVYTGKAGRNNENYYGSTNNHIIDPSLKVIEASGNYAEPMGYWPSYANITPQHRAGYLNFLASGANNPKADMGYLFLYFYGLEARLIKDEAISEYETIVGEVQRLREVFLDNGELNRSFDMYSKAFLSAAYLIKHKNKKISEILDYNAPEFSESKIINICISELAQQDKAIPAELILKGIRGNTYCSRISYRRTREEFDKLFIKLFNEKYPKGFKAPNRKSRFAPEYSASSGNFRKAIYRELPLIVTESFFNQFDKIINLCCDKLDEYSRYLGKNEEVNSLYSKMILPAELTQEDELVGKYVKQVKDGLDGNNLSVITSQEFALQFNSEAKLSRKEYENIANFYNNLGLGLLPSPNYGDNNPRQNDNIVIFELPGKRGLKVSPDFISVKNIVDLSVAVADADDVHASEVKIIYALIDSYKNLNVDEVALLKIRVEFLKRNAHYLRDIKSRLGSVGEKQKRSLIEFLITVVIADGRISNEETKVLKSIYAAFGYDDKQMYSDLHQFQTEQKDEPILVSVGQKENTFKIPKKPKAGSPVSIDMNLVKKKRAETKKVADALHDIFKDTEQEQAVAAKEFTGMDGKLSEFFAILITQNKWQRVELESHAKNKMLFLGSALEKINDWSLENYEETIVDDEGETLTVNKELVA